MMATPTVVLAKIAEYQGFPIKALNSELFWKKLQKTQKICFQKTRGAEIRFPQFHSENKIKGNISFEYVECYTLLI